jgi:hypothetical protein
MGHPHSQYADKLTNQTILITMIIAIIYLAIVILCIASMWILFQKAGKPGWASIVPIYNYIVMLEIIGKPIWWLFMMLIPFVNIYFAIKILVLFVKSYGKSTGYAIGCIFLPFIFYPMLAFSSDTQYVGAGNNGPSDILDASVR